MMALIQGDIPGVIVPNFDVGSGPFHEKNPEIPIAQVYQKSLDLFQDPKRFIKEYYCKNENGEPCAWRKTYSCCALGALIFFSEGYPYHAQCCLQRVSEHLFKCKIQLVNDGSNGYENVKQALQFAIELWKGRQPTEEELSMSVIDLLKKRESNGLS